MQKKKLDLNHLLAKYEGISNNTTNSPLRERNNQRIEEEFYQHPSLSRTMQEPSQDKHFTNTQQVSTRTAQGNFAMSKSEVESYLLSLRQDIRSEQRTLAKCSQTALKTIHENFQRSHQKIRRELLQVLDRAFQEVERTIKDQLLRQSKIQSPELTIVYRKISALDQDIQRMINGLRGAEYRRIIAQVVTRDFTIQMNELRSVSNSAKSNYLQSLGEVEADRAKIQIIKQQVQKLFYVNRKMSAPVSQVNPVIREQSSSGIFGMFKQKAEPPVANSRTRKSFFNFGSD